MRAPQSSEHDPLCAATHSRLESGRPRDAWPFVTRLLEDLQAQRSGLRSEGAVSLRLAVSAKSSARTIRTASASLRGHPSPRSRRCCQVRGGDGRSERCSRMCGSGRWMIRRAASSEQLMGKNIAVDPLTPVELRVGIADSGRGAAPGTERRRVRHRLVQRSRRARQCTSSAAGRWKLACGYPRDADRLPRRVPTVLDDRPLVRRAAPIPLQRQLDA